MSIALACLSIFHRIANRSFERRLLRVEEEVPGRRPRQNRGHRPRLQQRSRPQPRRRASLCRSSKQRQNKIDGKDLLQANELMIAVTFALPAESSAFLRRLGNKSQSDRQGIRTIRGKIDDRTIEVLHTGVGEKTCRQRMASFLQDRQFDCLISAGFAGALDDKLHTGDLLFAENFSTVQLNEMRPRLGSSLIHRANLLTVPSIIDSIDERQKIAQATGAAAIDMETEFIARGCAEHGVPLLSLRVISDTPSEPFPGPSKILFDVERQRTNAMKLSLHLLGHPTAIPRLILFARRIARARETLANALVDILREL
jgi:adenosylhomocysteine nucleosidase